MLHETQFQHLTVEELAQRCGQETDLYFRHQEYDPGYCFELFRRAIRDKDERALEGIIVQYQPSVARWVERWIGNHLNFLSLNEEPQDFIAQAFERFWASFTPDKLDKSQSLAALLRYLQMCVHGALTDSWRKFQHLQFEHEIEDEEHGFSEAEPTPEELVQKDEFWRMIKKKSRDPREYTVIYAAFYLNLSPRDILAEYPGEFSGIKEIYQYKANFLDRLERDQEIKEFVQRR
jgi:DNA-directed RNA polymerase specialized sigma24 family protein